MDSRYRFLTLGTPWTQSMPSRDVNAVPRLAEASWWRDNNRRRIENGKNIIQQETATLWLRQLIQNIIVVQRNTISIKRKRRHKTVYPMVVSDNYSSSGFA